ncbi:MAG: DUF99 family protein [Candidatus Bathyarchaeota archaeon]|nr:DUF99 family protein [Candidatus Bathyarchaeota archaeon]MCX8161896.1 DUF99 family protein [Candidatus Bathyarchaeota archaeon]
MHRLRSIAFEDAAFVKDESNGKALLIAVVMDGFRISDILFSYIIVDGLDSTDRMLELGLKIGGSFDVILLHGAPYGGFNIVDIEKLYSKLRSPIISVISSEPDEDAVLEALRKHFDDWIIRSSLLEKFKPIVPIDLKGFTIYISCYGIDLDRAVDILRELTVIGKLPEPLRVARLIARSLPINLYEETSM